MKLWTMISSLALAASLFSGKASADQAKLQTCVQKCTEQKLICITGQEPNLSVVCNSVPECEGMQAEDLKIFRDVCDLCIKGVTQNCPSETRQGQAPSQTSPPQPPAQIKSVRTAPQPLTFESACKAKGGVPVTNENPVTKKPIMECFTLEGAHLRLLTAEATLRWHARRIDELEKKGLPLPPEIKTQVLNDTDGTQKLLDSLQGMKGQFTEYNESVAKLVSDLAGKFASEVKRIDDKNVEQDRKLAGHEERIAGLELKPPTYRGQGSGSLKGALTGMYVGPYYGRQLYNHFGVGLNAVGAEMGILPSLSESGAWRLELNFGAGYGGKNKAETDAFRVRENLWEMHAHVGPRYTFENNIALTGGLGMNRRATFSHDDVAATWIGAFIQPSVSLVNEDGHGLYFLGRLGVGNTHFQHAILDKTGNKLDYEFNIGLGYAFMPIAR